jgi:hypothetical protein
MLTFACVCDKSLSLVAVLNVRMRLGFTILWQMITAHQLSDILSDGSRKSLLIRNAN